MADKSLQQKISPAIGVALMIAITVILAAVIAGLLILTMNAFDPAPQSSISVNKISQKEIIVSYFSERNVCDITRATVIVTAGKGSSGTIVYLPSVGNMTSGGLLNCNQEGGTVKVMILGKDATFGKSPTVQVVGEYLNGTKMLLYDKSI